MNTSYISQQIGNPILNYTNVSGVTFVQGLIPALINLAFVVGAIFFLFNLIMGGIKWISSGGDKGNLESARGQVTHAVIGMAVLLATYAIVKFMESFFGINLRVFDFSVMRINI